MSLFINLINLFIFVRHQLNLVIIMKIYIVGIGCVGKTTIGKLLAELIDYNFYDLDEEVERFYNKPIEKLQQEFGNIGYFRYKASIVLNELFNKPQNLVISGTTAGMMSPYYEVYKEHASKQDIISIHLTDSPENILKRIVFFDENSKPMHIELDKRLRRYYLSDIKKDLKFFKKSLVMADLQVSIENMPLEQVPNLLSEKIEEFNSNKQKV